MMHLPLEIHLENAGKRFNRDWIFHGLTYSIKAGARLAITGSNGSGKSTLLQCIASSIQHSEGKIGYFSNGNALAPELVYSQVSIAAPYLEVIEEMSALEFLEFHGSFKPFIPGFSLQQILEQCGLGHAANKQIRFYSSGMKQRIKLAQAIFSDVPVVLLDEPCTNLDAAGFELYNNLISRHSLNRTVIVSSNDPQEYHFCTDVLSIMDYK